MEDMQTQLVVSRVARMQAWLTDQNSDMRPSEFWKVFSAENVRMIEARGIGSFKRTLSQNYFNFTVGDPSNAQMQALITYWAQNPESTPLAAELVGSAELESLYSAAFLKTKIEQKAYTLFVGLLWWYTSRRHPEGLTEMLQEPELGNPVSIYMGERRISQDLANSIREWSRVAPFLKSCTDRPIVAEIGAGYGRVGAVAVQAVDAKYWIFDISPALAVAEWYLTSVFPGKRAFRWREFTDWSDIAEEVQQCDLAFFSVDQLSLIPNNSVDAFVTISALHEMLSEQIDFALDAMSRSTRRVIYTKNWTAFSNPVDGNVFYSSSVTPRAGWSTHSEQLDDVYSGLTEHVFLKDGL